MIETDTEYIFDSGEQVYVFLKEDTEILNMSYSGDGIKSYQVRSQDGTTYTFRNDVCIRLTGETRIQEETPMLGDGNVVWESAGDYEFAKWTNNSTPKKVLKRTKRLQKRMRG